MYHMYHIAPAAFVTSASSCSCAATGGSGLMWLWIPLGGFAVLNAALAFLRLVHRDEA
jgi:hypothetical protein